MNDITTEILARIEMLESDVKELRDQVEGVGVVFEMDMDELGPEFMLFFEDDENIH